MDRLVELMVNENCVTQKHLGLNRIKKPLALSRTPMKLGQLSVIQWQRFANR